MGYFGGLGGGDALKGLEQNPCAFCFSSDPPPTPLRLATSSAPGFADSGLWKMKPKLVLKDFFPQSWGEEMPRLGLFNSD